MWTTTTSHPADWLETIDVGTPSTAVRTAMTTMMLKGQVPGLSVAVVNQDQVLLAGGYGRADLRAGTPAMSSTAYLWFSMTKLVTATAALQLADDGLLDLSAPVTEYVDYLQAPGHNQPSVQQLLNHTAGLGNPLPISWAHPADAEPPDAQEFLRRVMGRRRAYRYPVGQAARYSNVGYLAAGQVIAAAAGMAFEDYLRHRVLDPLGMDNTGISYRPGAERATGYVKAPPIADPLLRRILPRGIAGNRHGPYLALNRFYVNGPAYGGLVGDVLDASRFLRMHLRDGELDGQRILSPHTARRMRTINQAGKPFHHGTGWFTRPSNIQRPWVEHFGTGVGFWNVMRLYTERRLGIVVMTNSTTSYDFEPLFALLAGASWS